jgi:hypothetical protein
VVFSIQLRHSASKSMPRIITDFRGSDLLIQRSV